MMMMDDDDNNDNDDDDDALIYTTNDPYFTYSSTIFQVVKRHKAFIKTFSPLYPYTPAKPYNPYHTERRTLWILKSCSVVVT